MKMSAFASWNTRCTALNASNVFPAGIKAPVFGVGSPAGLAPAPAPAPTDSELGLAFAPAPIAVPPGAGRK